MYLRSTRVPVILINAALLAASAGGDGNVAPKIDPNLAPLARFAGEWTVDGKWSDGNELHARAVYELRLDGKILAARTFVKDGDRECRTRACRCGILPHHCASLKERTF